QRAEEGELPDGLVRLVEEALVVLEEGEHEQRAALSPGFDRRRKRLAGDSGCVVLEYVAHVARLVEDERVRTGVRLDVVDRAAEVEEPGVGLVQLLIGETDQESRRDSTGEEETQPRVADP